MKKRTICKLLAFALTLALVFPLSVAASESDVELTTGSHSWTSGDYTYVAYVNPDTTSQSTRDVTMATADHTFGYATTMYIPTSNAAKLDASTDDFRAEYRSNLIQALNNTGLYDSFTYPMTNAVSYTIPAYKASGTYRCFVTFEVYSCSWSVRKAIQTWGMELACSGTLEYAPSGVYELATIEKIG